MASFCSKCGAELSPGAQSCTACGTPVVAGSRAALLNRCTVACTSQAQAPAPSRSSLIIFAVFVGPGIIGAGAFGYFVWRVAHAVYRFQARAARYRMPTPGGTITAKLERNLQLSRPWHRHLSRAPQPGKGSMRMTLPTGSMVTAVYVTPDSKDQVLAFYKSKLGDSATMMDTSDGAIVTLNKGQQESVMVTITANSSAI